MSTERANPRYQAIVEAALTFFTILVGLKLADLIDKNGALCEDKWPCFVTGVAVLLRYVTGSFNHQRAQHVNQPGKHDVQFLVDIFFLIAFGIIAVWACVAETVLEFFFRLILFTYTAIGWTIVNFFFELAASVRHKAHTFKFGIGWFVVNLAQLSLLYWAKSESSHHALASVRGFEFRWLWVISGFSALILLVDLLLQLTFHNPPKSNAAASHTAATP
jgi:hypothetical protein